VPIAAVISVNWAWICGGGRFRENRRNNTTFVARI